MSTKVQNSGRVKYLRLLERFVYSISRTLSKSPDLSRESFDKKVDRGREYLSRCEKIDLYKTELLRLEECATKIFEYRESEKGMDEIRDEILRLVNLYEKERSNRRYKKEKHKKRELEEWE